MTDRIDGSGMYDMQGENQIELFLVIEWTTCRLANLHDGRENTNSLLRQGKVTFIVSYGTLKLKGDYYLYSKAR